MIMCKDQLKRVTVAIAMQLQHVATMMCPAKVNQLSFHGYSSLSSPILPFFYFTKTRVGSFTWPRVAEDSHATAPSVRAEVRETAGVLVLLSINQVGYNKLSQISPMQL
jgi:hypothetical protein